MGKEKTNISGRMRITIVVSAIWFFSWLFWALLDGEEEGYFLAIMPLIVFWGIWWVIDAYLKHKETT